MLFLFYWAEFKAPWAKIQRIYNKYYQKDLQKIKRIRSLFIIRYTLIYKYFFDIP